MSGRALKNQDRQRSKRAMIYTVIPYITVREYTRDCLSSLQRQTVAGHGIIVVNDGSTDGTKEMLQKEFPEVIVLQGDGNLFLDGRPSIWASGKPLTLDGRICF